MERFDTQFTNIDAFLTVLDGSAPEVPLQPEPECDLTLLGGTLVPEPECGLPPPDGTLIPEPECELPPPDGTLIPEPECGLPPTDDTLTPEPECGLPPPDGTLIPDPECDLTLLGDSDGFRFVIGDINDAAGWETDGFAPLGWPAPLAEFGDADFAGGALFAIPEELFAGVVLADM